MSTDEVNFFCSTLRYTKQHEEREYLSTLRQEDIPAVRKSAFSGKHFVGRDRGVREISHDQYNKCGSLGGEKISRPDRGSAFLSGLQTAADHYTPYVVSQYSLFCLHVV